MPRQWPSLALFGAFHLDDVAKVTRELDEFSTDADAIFVDYPADPIGLRELLYVLLRAPIAVLGAIAISAGLQRPLFLLVNRDFLPTEMVAVQRMAGDETPVHRVDKHLWRWLVDLDPWLSAVNWLVVFFLVWLWPVGTLATVGALLASEVPVGIRRYGFRYVAVGLALGWYVAFGGLIVAGYLSIPLVLASLFAFVWLFYRTIERRSEVILDRLSAVAAEREYDAVVLVIGRGHLAGMARLARERGLTVPRVHASRWLQSGTTHAEFTPESLPGNSPSGLAVPVDDLRSGARVVDRLRAGAVDTGIAALLAVLLGILTAVLANVMAGESLGEWTNFWILLAGATVSFVGWWAVPEAATGQTFGKRGFDLVVADGETGKAPSLRTAVLRNLLRPIDAALFYVPSALLIRTSARNRGLGDRLAGTVVVDQPEETPGEQAADAVAEQDPVASE